MEIIRESLMIDSTSPTYLRWKTRPRHHFKSDKYWRRFNKWNAGLVAGCQWTGRDKRSYFQIKISGKIHLAHRIVFAITHGFDPAKMYIDHRDGDGKNNNPSNLRLATHSENMQNRKKHKNNTSQKTGVTFDKDAQKWRSSIGVNGRLKFIGLFTDIKDAAAAREVAARECFGEFHRQPTI